MTGFAAVLWTPRGAVAIPSNKGPIGFGAKSQPSGKKGKFGFDPARIEKGSRA